MSGTTQIQMIGFVALAFVIAGCAAKPIERHCPYGKDCHRDNFEEPELLRSDQRLKQDIRQIGTAENGLPIYLFRYKGEETWRIGVMAQDVLEQSPDAVSTTEDGYYAVNYGRIAW